MLHQAPSGIPQTHTTLVQITMMMLLTYCLLPRMIPLTVILPLLPSRSQSWRPPWETFSRNSRLWVSRNWPKPNSRGLLWKFTQKESVHNKINSIDDRNPRVDQASGRLIPDSLSIPMTGPPHNGVSSSAIRQTLNKILMNPLKKAL